MEVVLVFRKNWARTALMLMLFTVLGYEMNLDGVVQMFTDGADAISSVCTGKPIKIPAKKVASF